MARHTVTPAQLPKKTRDLAGRRFDRLFVVNYVPSSKNAAWRCLCDCGNWTTVRADHLVQLRVRSCGCLMREVAGRLHLMHGETRARMLSREYRCWWAMHCRCNDKRDPRYGGRGIAVCERWTAFVNFVADMGRCPKGMSIDRIDNDLGYSPENCRWADHRSQSRNRSSNRRLTLHGKTLCIAEWCEEVGLPRTTVLTRLKRGWSVEETLTTPRRSLIDHIRPNELRYVDTRKNHHRR